MITDSSWTTVDVRAYAQQATERAIASVGEAHANAQQYQHLLDSADRTRDARRAQIIADPSLIPGFGWGDSAGMPALTNALIMVGSGIVAGGIMAGAMKGWRLTNIAAGAGSVGALMAIAGALHLTSQLSGSNGFSAPTDQALLKDPTYVGLLSRADQLRSEAPYDIGDRLASTERRLASMAEPGFVEALAADGERQLGRHAEFDANNDGAISMDPYGEAGAMIAAGAATWERLLGVDRDADQLVTPREVVEQAIDASLANYVGQISVAPST